MNTEKSVNQIVGEKVIKAKLLNLIATLAMFVFIMRLKQSEVLTYEYVTIAGITSILIPYSCFAIYFSKLCAKHKVQKAVFGFWSFPLYVLLFTVVVYVYHALTV